MYLPERGPLLRLLLHVKLGNKKSVNTFQELMPAYPTQFRFRKCFCTMFLFQALLLTLLLFRNYRRRWRGLRLLLRPATPQKSSGPRLRRPTVSQCQTLCLCQHEVLICSVTLACLMAIDTVDFTQELTADRLQKCSHNVRTVLTFTLEGRPGARSSRGSVAQGLGSPRAR